jgi:NOL1/NOP2/fmu family ribosome biogenesis protein
LINNFPSLRLTSLGMLIGKVTGNEFLPSHEFVARFGQEFESGKIMLENEFLCAWLRGEDIRGYSIKQPASARIVVVMDQIGRNLGRGKILANQLKNLLPNRIF